MNLCVETLFVSVSSGKRFPVAGSPTGNVSNDAVFMYRCRLGKHSAYYAAFKQTQKALCQKVIVMHAPMTAFQS